MLELKYYPNDCLRKKCKDVTKMDKQFREWVHDIIYIMNANKGYGLAAPQVGLDQNFFVWLHTPNVVVNPIILKRKGKPVSVTEGCLSIPDRVVDVARQPEIHVSFFDIKGKEHNMKLKGDEARVFSHEYDHLQGRLILDYEQ